MTCGKGIRSRVGTGSDSDCTQPSTEKCSTTSCMVNEHLSVCVMDEKLMCDVFRLCNTFS